MDIFRICRTCLNEPNTELISIFSDINPNDSNDPNTLDISVHNGETKISTILDELTGNKYVRIIFYNCKIVHQVQNVNKRSICVFFFFLLSNLISECERISFSR